MRIAGLLFLFLALPIGAHPQDVKDESRVRNELTAAIEAIRKAIDDKDVKRLQQLYADGYTHTHGSGKIDGRDARIVSLLAKEPVVELAPMSEIAVRSYGGHTAIMQGRSPILNLKEQKYYDFRWLWVFVKDGGQWRLAGSQATRLPDPPREKP
jgi:ketosteroid isomerase-like protein